MNVIEMKETWVDDVVGDAKQEFIKQMYQYHQGLFDYSHLIEDTDIEKIEILPQQVVMTFRSSGLKFLCKEGDERSMPMDTLNFGFYEKKETDIIQHILSKINEGGAGMHVLDIGANIGYTACLVASNFRNSAVYAFEPIKSTYENLLYNIELNKLDNIKAYNIGLSNENKAVNFYYYPDCVANTSLANLRHTEDYITVPGELKRLDDLEEFKAISVDFIKCDVEGNELYVLQGAMEILKRDIPIIFMEVIRKFAKDFGYSANDIYKELEPLGYEMYVMTDDRKLIRIMEITEEEKNKNFFFCHPIKHKSLLLELCS